MTDYLYLYSRNEHLQCIVNSSEVRPHQQSERITLGITFAWPNWVRRMKPATVNDN